VVEHSFDFAVDIEQLFDTMTFEHPFDRLVRSLSRWGTGSGAGVSHPFRRLTVMAAVIDRVRNVPLPPGLERQIIVVDDCSTDGTREWLQGADVRDGGLKILFHEVNRGKGAALRTGFTAADVDIVVVQDADLEYDPREFPALLEPILDGRADVVFGTRFLGSTHRVLYFWHSVGNWVLTTLSNMLSNINLTDKPARFLHIPTAR
jgi:glycosyltransferase involved in cell wall biosynthesis